MRSPGSVGFCLQNADLGKVSDLAEPQGWQRCIPCGSLSLSASYPMTPALELKGFWAFIAWGVEAAHRARGWGTHIPTETGRAQRVPQNW